MIVKDHLISKIHQEYNVQLNEVSKIDTFPAPQSIKRPPRLKTWVLREKRCDVQNLAFNHNLRAMGICKHPGALRLKLRKPYKTKAAVYSGKKKASLVS